MAVKKIEAWQISTGQCFANKAEAYHEEMIYLVRTRGETNNLKIVSIESLISAIEMQEELVLNLRELKDSLKSGKDKKISDEVESLLVRAEGWLADAQLVQVGMNDPNET